MSKVWEKGSSGRWRYIRAWVLDKNRRENQGKCVLAVPKVCTGKANSVHHTLGRDVTGDDPAYLVACCMKCNLHVGQPKRISPEPKRVTKWK